MVSITVAKGKKYTYTASLAVRVCRGIPEAIGTNRNSWVREVWEKNLRNRT